jgi:hypothetical protein
MLEDRIRDTLAQLNRNELGIVFGGGAGAPSRLLAHALEG